MACFKTCWGFLPCCQEESDAFWSCYNTHLVPQEQNSVLWQQYAEILTDTGLPGQEGKQQNSKSPDKEALEDRDWERAASRSL